MTCSWLGIGRLRQRRLRQARAGGREEGGAQLRKGRDAAVVQDLFLHPKRSEAWMKLTYGYLWFTYG